REEEDGLVLDLFEERHVRRVLPTLEEAAQRPRVDDGAGEQVRAGLLPLLEQRDRHLAQPLRGGGRLLEQLREANRTRKARGAASHDEHTDLDRIGVDHRPDRIRCRERRRVVRRPRQDFLARVSSVSFGTISWRSPTTPRSQNSKIGAFGSLLIATTVPEPCIPTLCWIAPEIPHATYSFGETVLPVWPTWLAYGDQPASTTARVAAT